MLTLRRPRRRESSMAMVDFPLPRSPLSVIDRCMTIHALSPDPYASVSSKIAGDGAPVALTSRGGGGRINGAPVGPRPSAGCRWAGRPREETRYERLQGDRGHRHERHVMGGRGRPGGAHGGGDDP